MSEAWVPYPNLSRIIQDATGRFWIYSVGPDPTNAHSTTASAYQPTHTQVSILDATKTCRVGLRSSAEPTSDHGATAGGSSRSGLAAAEI
jgi:hypothetical protein